MKSKSRHQSRRQILGVITQRRAERILTNFTNAREGDILYLVRHHDVDVDLLKVESKTAPVLAPMNVYAIRRIARFLRNAWDTPDDRLFEWYLWKAMFVPQSNQEWLLNCDEPPERATALEAAVCYLRQNRRRALRCANPECVAPYFFQRKKGQKFCSRECALPAQRESKRRWWAANRSRKGRTR